MAITKFNKTTCETLSAEVQAALQELAAKHGLTVVRGGGTFGDAEYTMKLKFAVTDKEVMEASERRVWNINCGIYDLLPTDFGAEITHGGVKYRATAITSSVKFPIQARSDDGKTMRFSELAVKLIIANRK
jgi:hypothetical protein